MNKDLITGKSVIDTEIKSLVLMKKKMSGSFDRAIKLLYQTKGKIVVSGIGKSGHIASKISSTLSSIGSPSFYLHPSEANHGDLGMITKGDTVILISNSGETQELSNIILHCKKLKVPIVSITSELDSTLARKSEVVLSIPSGVEACPLELAPTSSTTCTLVLGDAIAVTLLKRRNFTSKDFLELHPGGKLGKKLITQVQDLMHKGNKVPKVNLNTILDKALIEITKKNLGITLVTNKSKIVGIFTDGDLRRCINKKIDIQKTKIKEVMTKTFKTIDSNALAVEAAKIMEENKIFTLVVLEKNKYIGVLSMHDLIEARIL